MTIWIIEPRDPLIVRDGRPFGPDPGARASSLPFPFPSTTAGGVRTRAALDDNGFFKFANGQNQPEVLDQLNRLRQLRVRGPLLVQLTADGSDIALNQWLVPAPRDALLFPAEPTVIGEQTARVQQLVPLQLEQDKQTDFDQKGLMLIGQSSYEEHKPFNKAPQYWYWKTFQTWLRNPSPLSGTVQRLSELGQAGPIQEQRLHVSIDADKEVAKDGMLFETSGLEFTTPGKGGQRLKGAQRLALAVAVDNSEQFIPRAGLAGFGGERRIVSWRKSSADLPSCPSGLEQTIITNKACRVFLLTPACFEAGYRPAWLLTEAAKHGVTAALKAIAVQHPQVVSGWDLVLRKPKPSRRLAPAGTAFFLSLKGSDTAIGDWIRSIWMQCISDDQQDRTDGFGLAVFGTWSGQSVAMQKGQQS
jgi:CRISPR-associated protein Cmr3